MKSKDGKEKFTLDISTSSIKLKKFTFQNRARESIILCRLDFGRGHRNPDGTEIGNPHFHIYDVNFGDKWAYPPPKSINCYQDRLKILQDFMEYCNIIVKPDFSKALFNNE